jgi:hypothetical protein
MAELGIPIPDPAGVRLSPWRRLQARVAPVDRLLAAREAAEDEEVADRSAARPAMPPPIGYCATSVATSAPIRARCARCVPATRRGPSPLAVPGAQARLDRILGREKWHQTGGSWISGAIHGANDGLAAVFGIVTGVSGATGGSSFV